ncbi:MAG TPA: helix-turn-helix domain-containing protein [Planctomycetota bacterium]|nr:helix-turn-helix domain-containing protein [Planctomycetota bacterium]
MIGNIIKKARLNQKLSQRELAKLTGVTQAGISKLELGGCDPSAKTMIKLTEVLGIQDKLFPTTNIDDKIDVDLEKRIERRVESRLEERLETRLESRLKEDITQDLLNELRKEIQVEFDRKFDPILQMISKILSYNNNLTCETCNAKQ